MRKHKKQFFYLLGIPAKNGRQNERKMEDFLRVNPGFSRCILNFLQFKDSPPMEIAEISNITPERN